MRSLVPVPGDPWPHDMVITVEDSSYPLFELLWVREGWGLRPAGDDLPPLLVDTPAHATGFDTTGWEAVWPEIWRAAVVHAASDRSPAPMAAITAAAPGSAERARLIAEMIGPTWRDRLGDAAFTDDYREWHSRQVTARIAAMRHSLDVQPERRSLDALIAAWRAGLTRVVTIPCRGEFVRIIGPHALLVTDVVRDDPDRYAAALMPSGSASPTSSPTGGRGVGVVITIVVFARRGARGR
jgi:hypothetical protein